MIGCQHNSVTGGGRGWPRKTWRECVEEDMAKLKLSMMVQMNVRREVWRNGILGNHLTCSAARKK